MNEDEEWCCGIITEQIRNSNEFDTKSWAYCPHCGTYKEQMEA